MIYTFNICILIYTYNIYIYVYIYVYIFIYIYIYTPGTITSPKHHGSASMEKEKIVLSLW